jgi:hypothetical protein
VERIAAHDEPEVSGGMPIVKPFEEPPRERRFAMINVQIADFKRIVASNREPNYGHSIFDRRQVLSLLVRGTTGGHEHDLVQNKLIAGVLGHDQVAEVYGIE